MQKIFLLTVFALFLNNSYSQVKFEKGYIIDNNGNRIEVFIQNKNWSQNPSEFLYKNSPTAEAKTYKLADVQEFGVEDQFKYVRSKINIDRTGEIVDKLTEDPNPDFKEETLFLKQLLEGEANLYSYRDGTIERFFYNLNEGDIQQLVYRKYLIGNKVAYNTRYWQQLRTDLNFQGSEVTNFERIKYRGSDLLEYFQNYNESKGSSNNVIQDVSGEFHVYLKAGVAFATLTAPGNKFKFDPGIRAGAEAEFILPFDRNKWAVFIEPSYQKIAIENEEIKKKKNQYAVNQPPVSTFTMEYEFLQISAGIRYYIYLNDSSKIFFNASAGLPFELSSYFALDRGPDFEVTEMEWYDNSPVFEIGMGYSFLNRARAELKYNRTELQGFNQLLNIGSTDLSSPISTISINLGYRIF